jgi:hypothetical protein
MFVLVLIETKRRASKIFLFLVNAIENHESKIMKEHKFDLTEIFSFSALNPCTLK